MKSLIVSILYSKLLFMQNQPSFIIYDASAGSGKTFTLVKAYLKILFQSESHFQFKNILAITFTNKAVYEMKERIIKTLKAFSNPSILSEDNTMFSLLCNELNMQPEALHSKSQTLLNTIIHNYAAFEISTIDGFTHRIIRTFAHDLKLPINFEVELDTDSLLTEAVDRLIAKAGTDQELTKILVQYAIEKADDDKSWDIALDLYKIAKLLVNENDIVYLDQLQDKTLTDFKQLKQHLKSELKKTEQLIIDEASEFLNLIQNNGIAFNDFNRSFLPKYFEKLANKDFNVGFNLKWQDTITTEPLYPARVKKDANLAASIDGLQPQIAQHFYTTKQLVLHTKLLQSVYKNITQLSVLNAINKELIALKTEENKMLISEFNTIISNEIKAQPTPFIYERLGEKFNHYFIDEFQDTSQLQWQNLIPLISETLDAQDHENTPGSLMLVGDAKQAIYRWRGGKAEQFIELADLDVNPFHTSKQKAALKTNFRSFKNVINFNNSFFKYLTNAAFSNIVYKGLYEKASQELSNPNDGYVNITFLDLKEENKDELYPEQVLKTIQSCISNGYNYKDICVLVRKRKEAAAVAGFLSEHDIQIISSESLLLKKSPEVLFVNNILTLLFEPKNNDIKVAILNYLADVNAIADKHAYFAKHLNDTNAKLFQSFSEFDIFSQSEQLVHMPLFDMAETIIRQFKLTATSNAYIQYYLDVVLDYTQKNGSDIFGFLDFFNKKMDKLSIVSPEGQNAIQIMTIHKSKGLEFPVVIFPYADLDIYKEVEPKTWFPLDENYFHGFSHTLINYNKDIAEFNETGLDIYNTHQAELELDNLNLLYVTLTRAVEQLHIISSLDLDAKGQPKTKHYSGLFIDFLMHENRFEDSTLSYDFGDPKRVAINESLEGEKETHQETIKFISTPKNEHNIKIITNSGYLWDTKQQDAIEKGNLVHNLMAEIKTAADIDTIIDDALHAGIITVNQIAALKDIIHQIINHDTLKSYFTSEHTIYNERDILAKNGTILRPDRLVISPNKEVTIIDYKTGQELAKHKQQLLLYQNVLEDMQFKVTHKLLVYINDDIQVKFV